MAKTRKRKINKKTFDLFSYLTWVTVALSFAVVADFFSDKSWFLDLFSHFVVQYAMLAVILFLVFFFTHRYWLALLALLIFSSQAYQVIPYVIPGDKDDSKKYEEVNIIQYNVDRNNNDVEDTTRWIISNAENADIVVLLEVNAKWEDSIRRIRWAYPYYVSKDMRGGRQMAIFSKLYVDDIEVKYLADEQQPALVLRGATVKNEVPFVIYGIHPSPPVLPSYAKKRNDLLVAAAESIAVEKQDHKILIADFNSTAFSPWFKKMEKISGLNDSNIGLGHINGTWPTVFNKFFGVNIDNMLISNNIKVEHKELGPDLGSDHYPVITNLKFMLPENSNI